MSLVDMKSAFMCLFLDLMKLQLQREFKKSIHISKVATLCTTKGTQESGGSEIKNAEKPCNESDPMPPKFY